jgi:hypothetical protein
VIEQVNNRSSPQKQANNNLLQALIRERTAPIFDSAVGVIFVGTSHRGPKSFLPESALLAAIAAQSEDLKLKFESGVLDALKPNRGVLLEVSDVFAKLCRIYGLLITCFFEQRESCLGKVIGRSDIQVNTQPDLC